MPIEPDLNSSQDQESIIEELLRLACDTSVLEGKKLVEKIEKILDIRLKNEFIINSLLNVSVTHDQISGELAANINKLNKDSIAGLVQVVQLLNNLPTGIVKMTVEEAEELQSIRSRVFGNG